MEKEWKTNGRRIEDEWKMNGRRMEDEWKTNGRRMEDEWKTNGRRMEDKLETRRDREAFSFFLSLSILPSSPFPSLITPNDFLISFFENYFIF